MATEVTVAPTLGHSVLVTQGGVGATPGYDAIDLRRMIEAASAIQEGAFDSTGWKVTENAGGPNMTVQVAANVGLARVDGDSVAFQSAYVVAPHSAVVTLDVAAAHSTNPRVDMVALQVRDNTHDASGQNDARVVYLTGTATSGATLDNLNGSPSLPSSAIRLADVLVPAADTTISNSQIRDRRKWARGLNWFFRKITSGPAVAAGVAVIDATNWAPRVELSGKPLLIEVNAQYSANAGSSADSTINMFVFVDSAAQNARSVKPSVSAATGSNWIMDLVEIIAAPTAGSHIIDIRQSASNNTNAILNASSTGGAIFRLTEIQPSAGN